MKISSSNSKLNILGQIIKIIISVGQNKTLDFQINKNLFPWILIKYNKP